MRSPTISARAVRRVGAAGGGVSLIAVNYAARRWRASAGVRTARPPALFLAEPVADPASVRMIAGAAGSSSIFARNWPMKTRRYWVSSLCAGPHDRGENLMVRHHPAGMAGEHAQKIVFLRRQLQRRAVPVTRRFSMSTTRPCADTVSDRRRAAGAMAQRRAQARQKLPDGERLLDIVIGAKVERGDLLGLAVARRQDDDRRRSRTCAPRPTHPFRPYPADRDRARRYPAPDWRSVAALRAPAAAWMTS